MIKNEFSGYTRHCSIQDFESKFKCRFLYHRNLYLVVLSAEISKSMHYVNWNIYQMDKTVAHIHVYRNKKGKSNWVLTKLNFKKQIIIYKSHIRTNITIRNTIRPTFFTKYIWPLLNYKFKLCFPLFTRSVNIRCW